MGLFDELRKLTRPYDDEEEEFFEEEDMDSGAEEEEQTPQIDAQSQKSAPRFSGFEQYRSQTAAKRDSKVVNIHNSPQLQVVLVKPERFEAAAEIADHLREKRTIVMNLEQTSKDVSRRLIDFLSGVTYALDGKIKKVAISTYIITPYNVDLMGDLIDELESNGLYF
jgi:cell division inhibitor SepF